MGRSGAKYLLMCGVILTLLLFHGAGSAFGAIKDYLSMTEGPFTFRYVAEDAIAADRIASGAPETAERLAAELGLKKVEPITVFLAASEKDYREALPGGGVRPEWSVGVAYSAKSLIIIYSPRAAIWSGRRINAHQVFIHEMCHVLLYRALGGRRPPKWLTEGFSKYYAGEWTFSMASRVTWALLLGRLIPLEELIHRFPTEANRVPLAYAESISFFSYLISKYGRDGLHSLILRLRRGAPLDVALSLTTGSDLFALEEDWKDYLLFHHTWISILGRPNTWWVFAALLIIVGFLKVRQRSRLKLKRMELEDRLVGYDEGFTREEQRRKRRLH